MKTYLIFTTIFCLFSFTTLSQDVYCSDLIQVVRQRQEQRESITCYLSDLLISVEYYRIGEGGFVVAKFKQNKYDFTGIEYIFCGISEERWSNFKTYGGYYSWGKAFHTYIIDYTCNCR